MISKRVQIRELIGWGLDDYAYRSPIRESTLVRAHARAASQSRFRAGSAVLPSETERLKDVLAPHALRSELLDEMSGLSWTLGVVDLRSLIAFQRRLYFSNELSSPPMPAADDWNALVALCFGTTKPPEYQTAYDASGQTLTVRSSNPNLHFRKTNNASSPLCLHTGSPFFEVASFADRWFLRDGYHRAYAFMRAGIWAVPAIIINTSTIEELGANQPWFFPETALFSETPPLVAGFLDDELIVEYDRPRLIKTLHITIEETLTPETIMGE